MRLSSPVKRLLSMAIIVALLGTQMGRINLSQGASDKQRLGVVAILVDDAIYSDSTEYVGLSDAYGGLQETTLKARIDRYAEQVQAALPLTKALIVRTHAEEKPENIMQALEKLYFEGDGTEDAITQLQGIVLVGNVPIPVVTKNDNRYLSLFPYTDFEDRVYLFNSTTGDFERSPESEEAQPEVWHGVIKSPVSGSEGSKLLADYFDKNTLYRQGYTEFSEFDQKLFYADTVAEKKSLEKTGVEAYQRFVDHWQEVAYKWYTADLARELFVEVNGSLEGGDALDNDGDGRIDEDPVNGYDDDNDGAIDEEDGNFYYGIDNDRDCWTQDDSKWDSNNDGIDCSTGDNFVDEDGTEDNNNDGDLLTDEDPIGDANGDGCSGQCGKDEDGDQADWDGDGWPNGWEIEVLDSKIIKRHSPFWYKPNDLSDNDQNLLKTLYTDERRKLMLGHPVQRRHSQ
ncbi:MAG: Shell matrix protein [Candidatus Peregrinibacteria bacterium GW2011_GWA2_44_7]|nr:MAG: Shell matrix protein [Candidatus Peregrinibacteria bacterium GW2011_GWA2_44_7]